MNNFFNNILGIFKMKNGKERSEIKLPKNGDNHQLLAPVQQENQQELVLKLKETKRKLEESEKINNQFLEKQLEKQELKMEIKWRRNRLQKLEKDLDSMANEMKSKRMMPKH